jgi:tRNA splicing ligase
MYSIREYAGYGKKKLHEFYQCIDKNCGNLTELNWHGEHFVTFVDNAKEMNEKFGFQFDLERLGMLDEIERKTNPQFRKMDLEETCDFLEREGYIEAAACLKKKVEWLRS